VLRVLVLRVLFLALIFDFVDHNFSFFYTENQKLE